MSLSKGVLKRIGQVAHARHLNFVELVKLGDVDQRTAFRGAELRDVDMRNQDLNGFDFSGTILPGCDLRGTDLSRTSGLTAEALATARVDETTRFPPGFGLPASQMRPPLEPLTRWREPIPGLPEEAWPDMITLPAGEFVMGAPEGEEGRDGDERPQRRVTVPRPFALGRTAVTFAMWDAAMAAGFVPHAGTEPPADWGWGRDDRPVIDVSWDDAQAYCRWLNQRLGLAPGTYRLPSEAEWEYACRSGTKTPFSFGETISTKRANFDGRATYGKGRKGEYRGCTVAVGSLPANPWGLHEMHGNVWEWIEDAFGPYPAQATDASPVVYSGFYPRAVRGGCWSEPAQLLRSASRDKQLPGFQNYDISFRFARTLG